MANRLFFSVFLIVCISLSLTNGQNLCQFRSSVESPTSNWSFLENFSTQKCLRVENFGHFPDRKLVLDECSYWRTALREQKIYLSNSTLGGFNLKVDAGLNEKYCVTIKDGTLYNADCRPNSFDQTWRFKPVRGQPNQYLVMQASSQKCLMPRARTSGATIKLVPCNSLQTEQIWKVCTAGKK